MREVSSYCLSLEWAVPNHSTNVLSWMLPPEQIGAVKSGNQIGKLRTSSEARTRTYCSIFSCINPSVEPVPVPSYEWPKTAGYRTVTGMCCKKVPASSKYLKRMCSGMRLQHGWKFPMQNATKSRLLLQPPFVMLTRYCLNTWGALRVALQKLMYQETILEL